MTTRIDAAQLIIEMKKNAANLMQLAEEMKQAAFQVMAERTFVPLKSDQKEAKNDLALAMHF